MLPRSFRSFHVLLIFFALLVAGGCESQSGDTLDVGVVVPLTGDNANYGQSARKGIETAIHEINDEGGINGDSLNAIYRDSKANPREGANVSQRLINVNQVPAIIGGITSGVTLSIAPIANENKVVLISPTASSPDLSDAGDYVFRNFPSDALEGEVMANFMQDRGLKNISILQIENDYGEGVASVFKEEFSRRGGEVVVHERYSRDESNFRGILEKAQSASPDAYYVIGYYEDGARLIRQARDMGIEGQFFATTTVEDPSFIEIGGEAVEGVVYPLASGYDAESDAPEVERFTETYQRVHGESPGFVDAYAYDCMHLIRRAIEIGGGVNGSAIQEGMDQIEEFQGATGTITFNKNGDVQKDYVMKVVKNGEFQVLK